MNYKGVIIGESFRNLSVLHNMKILETRVEKVTERHRTPWLTKWTLYTVEIEKERIEDIVAAISQLFDEIHPVWYADFKNNEFHFIVYPHKIFMVPLGDKKQYQEAREYGISIGIPEYQVDFAPEE